MASRTDEYRKQIQRCAHALSVAKIPEVQGDLAGGMTADMVKMFTDGNLDKRFEKLRDQLELLEPEFDDFEDRIADYVRTVPSAAYDTGTTDAERFLLRLAESCELSAEQTDLIACQRSRHAVEAVAEDRRMEHVRFQELLGSAERFLADLERNDRLRIYLNPVIVEAVFHTNILLDEDDETPATVVFFPVGNDVRTALLEYEGLDVVNALEASGPLERDAFAMTDLVPDLAERVELIRDLTEIGVTAVG